MLQYLRENIELKLWALRYVPMLHWIRPRIERLDDNEVCVRIPLLKRNRNHLNSMYFGVLCCGADLAGGLLALREIKKRRKKISFVFKDFEAKFLKRPEAAVDFICKDVPKIIALVDKVLETKTRVNERLCIEAYCPDKFGEEPVAIFYLTISLKER